MPFKETDNTPFTCTLRPLTSEEIKAKMREITSLHDEFSSSQKEIEEKEETMIQEPSEPEDTSRVEE